MLDVKPTLDTLRAMALDHRPEADYFVCLDRAKRMRIFTLQQQLQALEGRRAALTDDPEGEADTSRSLTDPDETVELAEKIAHASEELAQATEDARPWSVAIVFASLPDTDEAAREGEQSYMSVVKRLSVDGQIDTDAFGDELLRLCYSRTEAADGDLNLTWTEAARLIDSADRTMLRRLIVGHHRVGAAVPFDPRTSGPSVTT